MTATTPDRYLVGLIGSGITHSLTPPMHEQEAQELGLRYLYVPVDLDRLQLPPGFLGGMIRYGRLLGFRGFNVTHPCKQAVMEFLDTLAPSAAAVGAVNTVVFDRETGQAVGHNTDVYGFQENLLRGLPGASLEKVVVLGAGGAGSAIAHSLLDLGAGQVIAVDPDPARLQTLGASVDARFGGSRFDAISPSGAAAALADATGLVNATPVGMAAHPGTPVSAEVLRRDLWVADVVYLPLRTELLRAARALGCRTLDGGGMAVFQASAAFELFTGCHPDSDRMLRHFADLTADVS